jgi:rhodanese-related sulfurtransferase
VHPFEIAPHDAFARTGTTLLLDVREDDEWAAGRAPDSVHLPMSEIQARVHEVPTDRPLVVLCRVGARSGQVVMWLRQQGYDAVNVEGGLLRWQRDGLPLEGQVL